MLVAVLALLLVVFACGALLQRRWARWLGIFLAIVNLLLVLSIVMQGESAARALVWAIVPVVMLCYLFSPPGRQTLKADSVRY
jgi:predicted membrane protein